MVAIAAFVLVAAVGTAVDMSRAQTLQSRMQSALDAAGLGAAATFTQPHTGISDDQWVQEQAAKYFAANFPSGYLGSTPFTPVATLSADKSSISLSASTKETTSFMASAGIPSLKVGVGSQVKVFSSNPLKGICNNNVPGTCVTGSAVSIITSGNSTSWTCLGVNGGPADYSCSSVIAVQGVCGNAPDSCIIGGPPSITTAGWTCPGVNGGASSALCPAPSIPGVCGTTGACVVGTPSNKKISGGVTSWSCSGIGTGAPAKCNTNNPTTPGVCSASGKCSVGTPSGLTTVNNVTLWNCVGPNNGPSTPCSSLNAVQGVCGNTQNSCLTGTVTNESKSETQVNWTCAGSNGGTNQNCAATISIASSVPVLVVTNAAAPLAYDPSTFAVTGTTTDPNGINIPDAISTYDSNGNYVKTVTHTGGNTFPAAVAIGSKGDIWAMITSLGSPGQMFAETDYTLQGFNSDGNIIGTGGSTGQGGAPLWNTMHQNIYTINRSYVALVGGFALAPSVAIDPAQNVWASGIGPGAGVQENFCGGRGGNCKTYNYFNWGSVAKYSSTGVYSSMPWSWAGIVEQIFDEGNYYDPQYNNWGPRGGPAFIITSMAFDSSGNAWVIRKPASLGSPNIQPDPRKEVIVTEYWYVLEKYSPDGTLLVKSIPIARQGDNDSMADFESSGTLIDPTISVDASGNVWVAGGGGPDLQIGTTNTTANWGNITEYDPNGKLLQVFTSSPVVNGVPTILPSSVAVNTQGEVYAIARTQQFGYYYYTLIKYNSSGTIVNGPTPFLGYQAYTSIIDPSKDWDGYYNNFASEYYTSHGGLRFRPSLALLPDANTLTINGKCGPKYETCDIGTPSNSSVSGGVTAWKCDGAFGGSNASCTANTPINGNCGTPVIPGSCQEGIGGNITQVKEGGWFSPTVTYYYWNCNGEYGGKTASNCSVSFTTPAQGWR